MTNLTTDIEKGSTFSMQGLSLLYQTKSTGTALSSNHGNLDMLQRSRSAILANDDTD